MPVKKLKQYPRLSQKAYALPRWNSIEQAVEILPVDWKKDLITELLKPQNTFRFWSMEENVFRRDYFDSLSDQLKILYAQSGSPASRQGLLKKIADGFRFGLTDYANYISDLVLDEQKRAVKTLPQWLWWVRVDLIESLSERKSLAFNIASSLGLGVSALNPDDVDSHREEKARKELQLIFESQYTPINVLLLLAGKIEAVLRNTHHYRGLEDWGYSHDEQDSLRKFFDDVFFKEAKKTDGFQVSWVIKNDFGSVVDIDWSLVLSNLFVLLSEETFFEDVPENTKADLKNISKTENTPKAVFKILFELARPEEKERLLNFFLEKYPAIEADLVDVLSENENLSNVSLPWVKRVLLRCSSPEFEGSKDSCLEEIASLAASKCETPKDFFVFLDEVISEESRSKTLVLNQLTDEKARDLSASENDDGEPLLFQWVKSDAEVVRKVLRVFEAATEEKVALRSSIKKLFSWVHQKDQNILMVMIEHQPQLIDFFFKAMGLIFDFDERKELLENLLTHKNRKDFTPIMVAAQYDAFSVQRILDEVSLVLGKQGVMNLVGQVSSCGQTALTLATRFSEKSVGYLVAVIAEKVDVTSVSDCFSQQLNQTTAVEYDNPLMIAAQYQSGALACLINVIEKYIDSADRESLVQKLFSQKGTNHWDLLWITAWFNPGLVPGLVKVVHALKNEKVKRTLLLSLKSLPVSLWKKILEEAGAGSISNWHSADCVYQKGLSVKNIRDFLFLPVEPQKNLLAVFLEKDPKNFTRFLHDTLCLASSSVKPWLSFPELMQYYNQFSQAALTASEETSRKIIDVFLRLFLSSHRMKAVDIKSKPKAFALKFWDRSHCKTIKQFSQAIFKLSEDRGGVLEQAVSVHTSPAVTRAKRHFQSVLRLFHQYYEQWIPKESQVRHSVQETAFDQTFQEPVRLEQRSFSPAKLGQYKALKND